MLSEARSSPIMILVKLNYRYDIILDVKVASMLNIILVYHAYVFELKLSYTYYKMTCEQKREK